MHDSVLSFAAAIFDMDGLLAHTSNVWRIGEEALLHRIGARWSPELTLKFRGMNAYDCAAVIHREFAPDLPVAECQKILRDALIGQYETGEIRPLPGAVELVRHLHGRVPMAVASGSPLAGIEAVTRRMGIGDCFDALVTSEDVPRGKPAPDVFLEAAKQLGIEASRCVVLEDAPVGVEAAIAGGMTCYCVPSCPREMFTTLPSCFCDSLIELVTACD
jgi:HAD superfamily hydrolase (TIGR01509 family)